MISILAFVNRIQLLLSSHALSAYKYIALGQKRQERSGIRVGVWIGKFEWSLGSYLGLIAAGKERARQIIVETARLFLLFGSAMPFFFLMFFMAKAKDRLGLLTKPTCRVKYDMWLSRGGAKGVCGVESPATV
jgi:hypothetical protein